MTVAHTEAFLQQCFQWLCQTTLAASLLILLAFLVQWLIGRFLSARWLYALWLCVALRLVLPLVPPSSLSALNLFHGTTSAPAVPEASSPAEVTPARRPEAIERQTSGFHKQPVSQKPGTVASFPLSKLLAGVWLAGAIAYLAFVVGQHRRWTRWVTRQTPVHDPRILKILFEAANMVGYRRRLELYRTDLLATPSLFGWCKPRLLLPAARPFTEAELRLILIHELVHANRGDVLLNWGIIAATALHWFNPLVWFAMRQLRAARELACDEAVIKRLSLDDRKLYGETLINLVQSVSKAISAPTLVPIINRKQQLQRRIKMIAKLKPMSRIMTAMAAIILLALACLTFTRAAEKPLPAPLPLPRGAMPEAENQSASPNREAAQRRLKKMEALLAEQDELIKREQAQLDAIGPQQAEGDERSKKLIEMQVESDAEYVKIKMLRQELENLTRGQLARAITTASPDVLLPNLMQNLSSAEQKLAVLQERLGPQHPEVKEAQALMARIRKQIDERVDGILEGLKAKENSLALANAQLSARLETAKKYEQDRANVLHQSAQTRRKLDNLISARDQLQLRLIQERIEAALDR